MFIKIIGRLIIIWGELFFKLIVSFDGLVIRKKVLSESSHLIEKHLDVVVEVLEVQSIFSFDLFIGERFIELW